jgi:hypothetical protein
MIPCGHEQDPRDAEELMQAEKVVVGRVVKVGRI